ncbi:hypothetical protein RB201_04895 [Streptomyces sp. S1A(2023)]
MAVGSLRRDQDSAQQLLDNAARLYAQGVAVDWSSGLPGGRPVELSTYAFQYASYWLPDTTGAGPTGHRHGVSDAPQGYRSRP